MRLNYYAVHAVNDDSLMVVDVDEVAKRRSAAVEWPYLFVYECCCVPKRSH